MPDGLSETQLESKPNPIKVESRIRDQLPADVARDFAWLLEEKYREGYDRGFGQAMGAVRQGIDRELRVHQNMEIMRGRRG